MKVVILAGGLGTRMGDETLVRPKPLLEIGGHPMLWHIMNLYAHYGYDEFVLALGYRGDLIKEYFLNFQARNSDLTVDLGAGRVEYRERRHPNWVVHLIDTGDATQTGGRLLRLRSLLGDERFMLTYGDGLADVQIDALMRAHDASGAVATLTAVRPPARFGNLDIRDGDGFVETFVEKPQTDAGWINGGFFVFEPQIFLVYRRRPHGARTRAARAARCGSHAACVPASRVLASDGYAARASASRGDVELGAGAVARVGSARGAGDLGRKSVSPAHDDGVVRRVRIVERSLSHVDVAEMFDKIGREQRARHRAYLTIAADVLVGEDAERGAYAHRLDVLDDCHGTTCREIANLAEELRTLRRPHVVQHVAHDHRVGQSPSRVEICARARRGSEGDTVAYRIVDCRADPGREVEHQRGYVRPPHEQRAHGCAVPAADVDDERIGGDRLGENIAELGDVREDRAIRVARIPEQAGTKNAADRGSDAQTSLRFRKSWEVRSPMPGILAKGRPRAGGILAPGLMAFPRLMPA